MTMNPDSTSLPLPTAKIENASESSTVLLTWLVAILTAGSYISGFTILIVHFEAKSGSPTYDFEIAQIVITGLNYIFVIAVGIASIRGSVLLAMYVDIRFDSELKLEESTIKRPFRAQKASSVHKIGRKLWQALFSFAIFIMLAGVVVETEGLTFAEPDKLRFLFQCIAVIFFLTFAFTEFFPATTNGSVTDGSIVFVYFVVYCAVLLTVLAVISLISAESVQTVLFLYFIAGTTYFVGLAVLGATREVKKDEIAEFVDRRDYRLRAAIELASKHREILAAMLLPVAFLGMHGYAEGIYPRLKSEWGGGAPTEEVFTYSEMASSDLKGKKAAAMKVIAESKSEVVVQSLDADDLSVRISKSVIESRTAANTPTH